MYYLLDADLEDAEHMARVVRATAAELPMPKVPGVKKPVAKKKAAKKKAAKQGTAK
jgi:hypothetical protein